MLPKVETILYCTQMGPNSSYVFRHAYSLAKDLPAKIVVLHVLERLTRTQKAFVEGYSGQGTLEDILARATEEAHVRIPKRIEEFCSKENVEGDWHDVVKDVVVVHGHAAETILEQVEATQADLVVIGASADSSLLERLTGNTAQKVIRSCPVPVITVQVPEGHQDLTIDS
ncbi:MAG: universal stress protein [Candidatus Eisenbacteria bacterium]|uniref:Universal stress protein n=1 Tax=Eiseniibacteriota bacterium TaxID=2212470 RepID=A0A956SDP6_UNCEI|nr:universal stress protein [Candidatus Eisenbacteria bacterium]MCB9465472.1 universal stress protein [Candidatus Eisenbacteria bacterium]